jgi:hypothetical protein
MMKETRFYVTASIVIILAIILLNDPAHPEFTLRNIFIGAGIIIGIASFNQSFNKEKKKEGKSKADKIMIALIFGVIIFTILAVIFFLS